MLDPLEQTSYKDGMIVVSRNDYGRQLGEKFHGTKCAIWEAARAYGGTEI